ncbi:MAG: tryptophan halogenase family protein [Pseudomonadota bacterium]
MDIVVVGGGSAGWISASLLNAKACNRFETRPRITLIESKRIGRIGVGEATVPTIRRTLEMIGIPEKEFLNAADATFKHGISFEDWSSKGSKYFHPFTFAELSKWQLKSASAEWLGSDRAVPYIETISEQIALAYGGVAPKRSARSTPTRSLNRDYDGEVSYAYHMDAEKFADTLTEFSTKRGVKHVIGDVVDVVQNEEGFVTSVTLADGKSVDGDLFIDCTGFARRLIGQALGGQFVDFGQWLLCDSAVAFRIPFEQDTSKTLKPYTVAKALEAGWCWDIPLQTRRGTGYVYSSQFLDKDEAEATLRRQQSVPSDLQARHIRFKSGRADRFWIKNVVAMGLAGGFLEPLESTGLYFVEEGVTMLSDLLPTTPQMDMLADLYNRKMTGHYEECLYFINLHYCLTARRDTPFWCEVAKPERIHPRVQEKLAFWEQKLPSEMQVQDTRLLFGLESYEAILFGMGWEPSNLTFKRRDAPSPMRDLIQRREERLLSRLPKHEDYLAETN